MRLSHLFFTTLRDDPADAEMPSHRLLVRAGYVRQLGSGIYSLLPLGKRVNDRVEQVIREEQDRIGGQEMEMPVVHPAELWRESGRYQEIGPEMVRFKDRAGRDSVIAMTHEEVVADLTRDLVRSYRQLPMIVYHFQTKFRDEPRARGGLIRVREFVMKDSYTLDRDWAGLVGGYYRRRWALWFGELRKALTGEPTTPIDWYDVADEWVREPVAVRAPGDSLAAARSALTFAERL